MRVWISHSRDASEQAIHLREAIAAAGHSVSAGLEDIKPGESIASRVVEAIRAADVVVALVSSRTSSSEWVASEIGVALQEGKRIIPVLVHRDAQVPALLNDLHYVDFSNDATRDGQTSLLSAALQEQRGEHQATEARVEVLAGDRVALEVDKAEYAIKTALRWSELAAALSNSTRSSIFLVVVLAAIMPWFDKTFSEHLYIVATAIAVNTLSSFLGDLLAHKRGARDSRD